MSRRSTRNPSWPRFLLLIHLVAVAASIVLFWPSLHDGGITRNPSALGGSAVFLVILFAIGASSSRLGGGYVLRKSDWALHALWIGLMLWSGFQGWGPFAFRLQPTPGAIDSLAGLETRHYWALMIRLSVLIGLYSGIPIGLSLVAGSRIHPTDSERARLPKILSMASFAGAVLASLLLRFVWHGSESVAGFIVATLLIVSFGIAAFFAARGDDVWARILLCEAGLFGLLRFV